MPLKESMELLPQGAWSTSRLVLGDDRVILLAQGSHSSGVEAPMEKQNIEVDLGMLAPGKRASSPCTPGLICVIPCGCRLCSNLHRIMKTRSNPSIIRAVLQKSTRTHDHCFISCLQFSSCFVSLSGETHLPQPPLIRTASVQSEASPERVRAS